MRQYLKLLEEVMAFGNEKSDRTGTGTVSVFGRQVRYPLHEGFPIVTTKAVHFPSIVHELLWFISGDTNIKYLTDNGVRIWNEWADKDGNLGPVYGSQWRNWKTANGDTVDQLANVVNLLRTNPDSRRIIISAWNVGELDQMALPPCHCFVQFYVEPARQYERHKFFLTKEGYTEPEIKNILNNNMQHISQGATLESQKAYFDSKGVPTFKLSCQLYQRSADIFLGVPFNIASYALLTHMLAQVTDMIPGDFVHTFGDLHLYNNHVEQALEQINRQPFPLPSLKLNPDIKEIEEFKFEDISLLNYQSHPKIKAPVAI